MKIYNVHFKKHTFTFDNIIDARNAKDVLPLLGFGAYQGCQCRKSVDSCGHYRTYNVNVEL